MASVAEMERAPIVNQTRAGLDVTQQLAASAAVSPKLTDSKAKSAKKLRANGIALQGVAKNLDVPIPTLYRCVPTSAHA